MNIIYKITNLTENKVYIGQTKQSSEKRFKRHKSGVKGGNKFIRESYLKNHDLIIEEIFYCFNDYDLNYFERLFIAEYNCVYPNGYNLTVGGTHLSYTTEYTKRLISSKLVDHYKLNPHPNKGRKFPEEHIKNLSKVRKGFDSEKRKIARRKAHEQKRVPIIAINLKSGERLRFESITECAKTLDLEVRNIGGVLNGRDGRVSHKGYTFEYENKPNVPKEFKKPKYYTKDKLGNYSINYKGQYIGYVKNLEDVQKIIDKLNNNSYNAEEFAYCLLKHKKTCHDTKTKAEREVRKQLKNNSKLK